MTIELDESRTPYDDCLDAYWQKMDRSERQARRLVSALAVLIYGLIFLLTNSY